MDEGESGVLGGLSASIGVNEAALKLLISLFAGYPLAFVYRYVFLDKSANVQHIYFIVTGLWLSYFNFGGDTVHNLANITIIYLVLRVLGGSVLSVTLCFAINLAYLLTGYYVTYSDSYDITWTIPQCVLLLKLTALAFDVYDGTRKPESLSAEQRDTVLDRMPSFLEVFGQSYFFGGFLVGPHFSMRRYLDFTSGVYSKQIMSGKPNCVVPAFARLALGLLYTALFQVAYMYLPETYMLTSSFKELSFFSRCCVIVLWSKVTLYKYVACWLIAEGSCILTGLTYNGKDETGDDLWDGCANMFIVRFERAASFSEMIQSFNVNTNRWMSMYVFKRLKFLGNKNLSQVVTLGFLAIWHGLSSGYLVTFSFEFFLLKQEREILPLFERIPLVHRLRRHRAGLVLLWCMNKYYSQFMLGYGLLGFCLFTFNRYWQVYSSMYLVGHVLNVITMLIQPYFTPAKPPQRNHVTKDD